MLISVVLSFRNEQETIPELIRRLRLAFEKVGCDYELLFVNDASTDNSLKILAEEAKKDKGIKVINMSRRFGIGPSIMAGMHYANGEAVIYMDSDLQDPPDLLPVLIKRWKEGADIVYTTRTKREGESFLKMLITRWAYKAINLLSETELPLNSGDFKLLDRRVVRELLKLEEKDPYVRGLVSWLGFKQEQVFYNREKRFSGKTHFPIFGPGPVKTFISGITSFSEVPLVISLIIGLVVSFGSFLGLIGVIILKLLGKTLPGWAAMMVPLLFLAGIQLFTIGIMGLYIGRIYNESKNRPRYIVESTIGINKEN